MKIVQEQKLEQKLILTQEMRQSLEILQLPLMELREVIQQEVMENPLLEIVDEKVIFDVDGENNDTDEYFYEYEIYDYSIKKYDKNDYQEDYVRKLAINEDDFFSEFKKEIFNELKTETEKEISVFILSNIDEHGFFKIKKEELEIFFCDDFLKYNLFEEVRKKIKEKQPLGVGSFDLQEYLILLLKNEQNFEYLTEAEKIIKENFFDFARKKIRELKKKTGVQEKVIKKIYEKVKEFTPYPLFGIEIDRNTKQNIFPEVLLRVENGEIEIYLVDKYLPELKFNNKYYKELSTNKEAVDYLKAKAYNARSLQKSIEQRNMTLYRVAKKISEFQKKFFLTEGNGVLKPLTLSKVAKELELHESTISRVVNGKYIDTPKGTYELKYFFDGKVATQNGENVSITLVKDTLKKIIKCEDKYKPFTDKEICEILEAKGFKVSQRTVANYREAIGILPTYLRKEI